MARCGICGNSDGNTTHRFRETMFGSGDSFEYIECGCCGCLWLARVPANPAGGYGPTYYSLGAPPRLFDHPLTRRLKKRRLAAALAGGGPWARLFLLLYPPHQYMGWMKRAGVTARSRILDVGCGAGDLLVRMKKDGFASLMGIDPYLNHDRVYENGVTVLKKELSSLIGSFDCIMLHHSFEHMADPVAAMARLSGLLRSGGTLLVRIPVAGTHAFRHYGRDWIQLDPPRHLFLHTVKSMELLALGAGFMVEAVVFDSDEFQFWGSEQLRQGIFLQSERSLAVDRTRSLFSRKQMRAWKKQARALNAAKQGDQACFFLRKGKTDGG